MDTTVADAFLGALIDGRYRVRARVARGGMATVYTASDERLERTVALKIIHPAQASDPRFVERFIDEAKIIARLTHPNVVAVYDQGTHEGLPYLVMEYIRGRTLREVLADRQRLQPPEALAVMENVLAAIAAAHRDGLVHRDVKPENVLVAEAPGSSTNRIIDGVVKVADFGLARAVERSAEDSGGQLLATAAYVAPELITSGHADPRTDVYSAGIVLFEMLTGQVPYDGDRPAEVAWQHVQRDVPPPSQLVPGLPPQVDNLVIRATRRDPGARPTDAGALLAQVQAARDDVGLTVASRPAPLAGPTVVVPQIEPRRATWQPSPRTGPPHRRRAPSRSGSWWAQVGGHPRTRLAIAAGLVILGLLAAVGGWWFGIGRYTETPGLLDRTAPQAEEQARHLGFRITYATGRHDEQKAKDVVLQQRPEPGSRILPGSTIVLVLSLGPDRHFVPEFSGKTWDQASAELKAAGLQPQRADGGYDDQVPKDYVLRTDPPTGSEVAPNTKIIVYTSKGKAPIVVPLVVGKRVDDARNALTRLGLQVAVTEKESDRPAGEVLTQNPPDGSGVERGATIALDVSQGPPAADVPDLRGTPGQQAKAQLEGLGFQVRIFGNPNGRVFIQNPSNGQLPRGSEISLVCA